MNVIPNSLINSPGLLANSQNVLAKTSKDSRVTSIKCVVCNEALADTLGSGGQISPATYQMLAVRPSIGSPAGPFFPVLENLTHTSAVRVPCCLICAQSLLDQWNEYESKNVSIKNRVYNLTAKSALQATSTHVSGLLENNASNLIISRTSPSPRLLVHQSPIVVNNGNIALSTSIKDKSNNSSTSSQDEVLDLSMSGSSVNVKQTLSFPSPQNMAKLQLHATNLTKQSQIASNICSISGSRSRTASFSNEVTGANIAAPILNSSMTNLIKVASNPVSLTLKSLPSIDTGSANNVTKPKVLYNCSLCDELCCQLLSIMIRPMGNCPYFPTLIPYVKSSTIDSHGKIGTCESCHRQLIQQWDVYQKSNKPIAERVYQLIRPSKHNVVISFPFHSDSVSINPVANNNTTGNNSSNNRTHIPPTSSLISQPSSVTSVGNKALFVCVVCGKDLLLNATNPMSNSSQMAFSMLTENDTTGAMAIKKLIVQSAQEFNLIPFLANTHSTSAQQHQVQILQDSGRVLICFLCFETIASRCSSVSTNSHQPNSNTNSNTNSAPSASSISSDPSLIHKSSTNRLAQDSVNGNIPKLTSSSYESNNSSETSISDLLCLACGHNKAQYMVETKENTTKKPFFPFLRDSNDPNGRARLCGACHLMLETQWDAFEAAYIPYSQRNYRLPSTSNGQNNVLISKRPSSVTSASPSGGINLSSVSHSKSNGQPTPPPLKIQISSPSIQPVSSQILNNTSLSSDHLLLTTVNSTSQTNSHHQNSATVPSSASVLSDNEQIFKLIDEFLSNLGGPHSILSGNCAICNEYSSPGKTYQVFSSSQKILLSPELGVYPYFPNLKSCKKIGKNIHESAHLACTFCYHSLIAQWAAYHLSLYPEDRDLNNRIYNCRDFICYVCGVTTYRHLVRSISIKDFPFLLEHKRPPGALSLCKGEHVVTCLNCFETLTHQWIENERMKVPLEMRKYNWIAVPPPPPPKSDIESKSLHSDLSRPGLTNHIANSTYPSSITSSYNGTNNVALSMVAKSNHSSSGFSNLVSVTHDANVKTNVNVVQPVVFNPSHTLAPLVAAAMAATPVTTKQQDFGKSTDSLSNSVVSTNTNSGASSFADVLRHLARQQSMNSSHKTDINMQLSHSQLTPSSTNSHVPVLSSNSSINLTTLASVAALAVNHRTSTLNNTSESYLTSANTSTSNNSSNINAHQLIHFNSNIDHSNTGGLVVSLGDNSNLDRRKLSISLTEKSIITNDNIPRTVINPKNFAVYFNSKHTNVNIKQESSNKKNNNHETPGDDSKNLNENVDSKTENTVNNDESHYDKCLSKVSLEEMKLKNKRIARLKNGNSHSCDNLSDMSDDELTAIDNMIEIGSSSSSDIENGDYSNQNPRQTKRNESLLKFIDSVIPVLSLDNNQQKTSFMANLGLTTPRLKRHLELDYFIKRKIHRRLSSMSYKLESFNDEDSILDVDPSVEDQSTSSYFKSSDIEPNSEILQKTAVQNVSNMRNGILHESNNTFSKDKLNFMNELGLVPSSNDDKLSTELTWLAVIRNRQLRKRRNIICVGKSYNNLSEKVLSTWLPQLVARSSSISSNHELINQLKLFIPIGSDNVDPNINEDTTELQCSSNEHGVSESINKSNLKTINCTVRLDSGSDINSASVVVTDNHQNLTNSTNKIINTKQFAQEFHELVLLETQKQMSKGESSANSLNAQHTIIYSDNLKPSSESLKHNQANNNLERNGSLLIDERSNSANVPQLADKTILKEQVFKLQQRLTEIVRESQYLHERKNEIITSIQKLDDERNLCQNELDRLAKCLE